MTRIAYQSIELRPATERMVERANEIIAEYEAQGFVLTLRQLYYQFVARDLLANTQQNYKRLGDILNKARLAGLVSWSAMEDRTRNLRALSHWDSPRDIVAACARQYREDLWDSQPNRVEVWIEKDALVGVIEGVCERNDVPYFACRGYTSQSEQWRAGRRFRDYLSRGQHVVVLHLGDHDPSGVDMTRDNIERLAMFAEDEIEVRRLALNMDQVRRYRPPPNPAKFTDSRAEGYVREYGRSCWELDALEPRTIERLIQAEIDDLRDEAAWDDATSAQQAGRDRLDEILREL